MIPLDMFKNISTAFMRVTCFAFQETLRKAGNMQVKKYSGTTALENAMPIGNKQKNKTTLMVHNAAHFKHR